MKKVLSLSLAAIVCLGMLGGCSQNPSTQTSTKVTLHTVSMFGGTDPDTQLYQDYIKNFEGKNKNVTIEDASATSDQAWKSQVINDFESGSEADVLFYFTGSDASTFVKAGKVVDVATIQKKYPTYAKNISESATEQMKESDGKNYAVPIKGYWEGIFCNKDLFDKYNLQLPTTWDNLLTAVKTFKQNNIVPFSVALGEVPHYWIEHLVYSVGGYNDHHLNPGTDMSKVPKSWIDGISLFKTFNDMGAFPSNTATSKDSETQLLFLQKKAAMQVDGSWFCGTISSKSTDANTVTVVPFPSYNSSGKDASDIIEGFSSGYYISKKAWDDASKRDAAVKFVEYMSSNDAIKDFTSKAGGTPAAAITADSSASALMKAGIDMGGKAKHGDAAMDARLSKACYDDMVSNAPLVAAGKMTATDFWKSAIAKNK